MAWAGDTGFTAEGKRKQAYVTSRTQAGARDKLRALKIEIADFGAPLDKSWKVERWAQHWLETVCRQKMRPKPYVAYESVMRTWILPTIGRKQLVQVKPEP